MLIARSPLSLRPATWSLCDPRTFSACGEYGSRQVGWHHKFDVARLNFAVTVEHLNRSTASRNIFNEPSVVRAIPGVAFGLKGPADSVAILKYGVAHDDALPSGGNALHQSRFRSRSIRPTPMRDREELGDCGGYGSICLIEWVGNACYIFATQLPKIGWDRKVSVDLRRILEPNEINRFATKAHCLVHRQANCKTV
jgi:hypothetical protein